MTIDSTINSSSIDYEKLHIDAMRGIVKSVLSNAEKTGLPGDHHFYISFETTSPGVVLSKRLLEKYPNEMTIVLQHRFWDLNVNDDYFEVKLTFDGIPERLVIPFSSLKVFFDPSVRYGLKFDQSVDQLEINSSAQKKLNKNTALSLVEEDPLLSRKTKPSKKNKLEKREDFTNQNTEKKAERSSENSFTRSDAKNLSTISNNLPPNTPLNSDVNPEQNSKRPELSNGAEVLNLDKFRKK